MMKRTQIRNQKGMATIETLPLLFIFVFLVSYMLGFFGVIHTAIMNSISARAYAFETFRNRANLIYFRDMPSGFRQSLRKYQARTHMVLAEDRKDSEMRAVERPIRIGIPIQPGPSRNDVSIHNDKIFEADLIVDKKRNQKVETSPVWVMIQYGMCLNLQCGDQK